MRYRALKNDEFEIVDALLKAVAYALEKEKSWNGDKMETVAEEAAEVSQAALKLIRAKELSWNPTPMDSGEAWENLCDEIIDLCLALDVCRFDVAGFAGYASSSQNPKLKRWVDRLEKKEDAE